MVGASATYKSLSDEANFWKKKKKNKNGGSWGGWKGQLNLNMMLTQQHQKHNWLIVICFDQSAFWIESLISDWSLSVANGDFLIHNKQTISEKVAEQFLCIIM